MMIGQTLLAHYVAQQQAQLCHISHLVPRVIPVCLEAPTHITRPEITETSIKVTSTQKLSGDSNVKGPALASGMPSGTRPAPLSQCPPANASVAGTPSATTPVRSFVAERKHLLSSDDEDSEVESPLRSIKARKRRRTVCVAAPTLSRALSKPLSPHLHSDSGSDEEFLSSVLLRRQQHLRRRSIASDADRSARRRCFDYLLSGIDAVWAEYCDSTLIAEEQRYTPRSPVSDCEIEPVSEQPHTVQLMMLKKQMLGSKYYMSDLVDSHDMDSSSRFWKCWDAVKFNVVEAVEGELEEADTILEDLEAGRLWSL